jgi:hypothetical protein
MSERRGAHGMRLFPLLLAGALGCGGDGGTDPDPKPQPTPVATSLEVFPDNASIPDGESRLLSSILKDQTGQVMQIPAGSALEWTSADAAVATVDASGSVLAQRPGAVWVRLRLGTLADSARVTVTAVPRQLAAVGATQRAGMAGSLLADSLAVRVTDRHGTPMPGVTVAFAATGGGVATPATAVTRADGTARSAWRLGTNAGPQMATATAAGLTGSPVTFTADATVPVPGSVDITPVFGTVNVGAAIAFAAVVRSTAGDVIPGANTAVTFSTPGTNVNVTAGGTVTGVTPGVNRVIGALGDLRDTSLVAVLGPSSVLATAFSNGSPYATAQRGDTVRIPVVLDVSRPSPTGALGSVQLEVVYDPAVLDFVRADTPLPGSDGNLRVAGRYAIAYAGTLPLGTGTIRLATLVLVVRGTAAAGAVSPSTVLFTENPRSTDFTPFSAPIIVHGRVHVP